MVTADNVGCPAIVQAADHFYAFINGWKGTLTGVANGLAYLDVEQVECSGPVIKHFVIPADQVMPQ